MDEESEKQRERFMVKGWLVDTKMGFVAQVILLLFMGLIVLPSAIALVLFIMARLR